MTLAELGGLARGEPTFAGRVLHWVNSAAFQRSRTVLDIDQATSILGVRGLRNVALGMVVAGLIPPEPRAQVLLVNGLRRALAARFVADHALHAQKDAAFTTGLFLEAGLLEHAHDQLDRVVSLAETPAMHRLVRERAEGLVPHPKSGAGLAERYGLPTELIRAVGEHHADQPPKTELSLLAWVSERIAGLFEGPMNGDGRRRALDAMREVGLGEQHLDDLLEALPSQIEQTARVFERDVAPQPSWQDLLADANQQLVRMNIHYEGLVRTLERVIEEKDQVLREREQLSTDLQRTNARLEALTRTDTLTQLPNRRALDEFFARELERAARNKSPIAFAVFDLDHFKRINDGHGHDVGDAVLAEVAARLGSQIRAADLAARFGGEEFVVVMPDTELEAARRCAERLREVIRATPICAGQTRLEVTASVGLAAVAAPTGPTDRDSLFRRADKALYAAKAAGRDRVVEAEPA